MTKKNAKQRTRFAICIADDLPSLQLRKVYRVLPDPKAETSDWIRVVDDFDEDYLYPASEFIFIELPAEAKRLMTGTPAPDRKGSLRRKITASRRRRTRTA